MIIDDKYDFLKEKYTKRNYSSALSVTKLPLNFSIKRINQYGPIVIYKAVITT